MPTCQASINFTFDPAYEAAHMPSSMVDELLKHSKACIHIYTFLCLLANKNEKHENEFGCVLKINTKKISTALGMKLRTVQQCLKDMFEDGLIVKMREYRNKDKDKDIYITKYREMYKNNNYIKLPEEVFSEKFFNSDKCTISLFIYQFVSIYKNVLAKMQRSKANNKAAQNFELINTVKSEREFTEKRLLKIIKRVSKVDLDKAIENVIKLGFSINYSLTKYSREKKFIVKADSIIRKMFKSKNDNFLLIRKYPNTFLKVRELLQYTGLLEHFIYKKEHEDLTQMCLQYGQIPLLSGLLAYKGSALYNENITDKCAYVRTCIDNWLRKQNKSE